MTARSARASLADMRPFVLALLFSASLFGQEARPEPPVRRYIVPERLMTPPQEGGPGIERVPRIEIVPDAGSRVADLFERRYARGFVRRCKALHVNLVLDD